MLTHKHGLKNYPGYFGDSRCPMCTQTGSESSPLDTIGTVLAVEAVMDAFSSDTSSSDPMPDTSSTFDSSSSDTFGGFVGGDTGGGGAGGDW